MLCKLCGRGATISQRVKPRNDTNQLDTGSIGHWLDDGRQMLPGLLLSLNSCWLLAVCWLLSVVGCPLVGGNFCLHDTKKQLQTLREAICSYIYIYIWISIYIYIHIYDIRLKIKKYQKQKAKSHKRNFRERQPRLTAIWSLNCDQFLFADKRKMMMWLKKCLFFLVYQKLCNGLLPFVVALL